MSSEKERVKKLVAVLATSTPVTITKVKVIEDDLNTRSILAQLLCICYLINFREKSVLLFFDSNSKLNAIYLIFAKELNLPIRSSDFGTQNIDGTMLDIYGMVVAAFSVTDKANRVRFFEKTFLVANIRPEVVFGMLSLTLSGTDIDFLD